MSGSTWAPFKAGKMNMCTMSIQSSFDSNAPLEEGIAPNTTYADWMKESASIMMKPLSVAPGGNVSKPLISSDREPWDQWNKLGDFTHYQLPKRLEWYGTRGGGAGVDSADNHSFGQMILTVSRLRCVHAN